MRKLHILFKLSDVTTVAVLDIITCGSDAFLFYLNVLSIEM